MLGKILGTEHLSVNKNTLLYFIPGQINAVHTLAHGLSHILISSSNLRICLPIELFSTGFPANIYKLFSQAYPHAYYISTNRTLVAVEIILSSSPSSLFN